MVKRVSDRCYTRDDAGNIKRSAGNGSLRGWVRAVWWAGRAGVVPGWGCGRRVVVAGDVGDRLGRVRWQPGPRIASRTASVHHVA